MEDAKHRNPSARSHSQPDSVDPRFQQANRQADAAKRYAAAEVHELDFKAEPSSKAIRSSAQREASRKNGARGRGPVTPEGKARSSNNSLKHGLLAKILCPPGDARAHDRLFRRIRTELMAEFNPMTFTERATVDRMAKLYVQSGRAEEMIESLQRPAGITQKDADAYNQLQHERGNLKQLHFLIAQLRKNEPLTCPPDVATLFAERVGKYVESVYQVLQEEATPVEEMDKFELEEDRELKQEWARLRPVKVRLTNRLQLSEVLSGRLSTTPAARRQLREVLTRLANGDRERAKHDANIANCVKAVVEQTVLNLANEPGRLMVLQRYANGIERSIRRAIAQLR